MLVKLFTPCTCNETKALSVVYEGQGVHTLDLTVEIQTGLIDGIKTIYVDNRNNSDAFQFICDDTYQHIVCPANKQGYFVICTGEGKFKFNTLGVQNVTVPLLLLNYEIATGVF